MSNSSDIIVSIAEFLDAVADLLATDAVAGVITIAKELGLEQQINSGVDTLVNFAAEAETKLNEWKVELTGVQGFASSVRLVYPLIESISEIVSNAAQSVQDAGINEPGLFEATQGVTDGATYFSGAIKGAISLLDNIPTVQSVEEVIESVGRIKDVLASFKSEVESEAA